MGARVIAFSNCGLSPLARGTRTRARAGGAIRRFIPAGAGNTAAAASATAAHTVYPRWRGEHDCRILFFCVVNGLSPLARGTLAGNTMPSFFTPYLATVYPRWRGEHFYLATFFTSDDGLSPLARGTRCIAFRLLRGERFIPAGAGNTNI